MNSDDLGAPVAQLQRVRNAAAAFDPSRGKRLC